MRPDDPVDDALLSWRARRPPTVEAASFRFPLAGEVETLVRVHEGFVAPPDCAALRALHGRLLPLEPTAERAHGRLSIETVRARGEAADRRLVDAVVDRILALLRRIYRLPDLRLDYAALVRLEAGHAHARHADNAVYDCPHGGIPVHRWHRDECAAGRWRPLDGCGHRDVSAVLYLNGDFVGGELFFEQHRLVVTPEGGLLATFPANAAFLHEVLPIESGVRHTLALWATREP